jgi:hypothetical protein
MPQDDLQFSFLSPLLTADAGPFIDKGEDLCLNVDNRALALVQTQEGADSSPEMMEAAVKLYHFTSARHLRGIALHGLTVGDVPTDIAAWKGCCGVWLTSDKTSRGQGLEGGQADKCRFRLTVEAPDNALLVKWTDWAPKGAEKRHGEDHARSSCHGDEL